MPETKANTLRITKTTFSADHIAPDGTHRFPAGLVVEVKDGAGTVDDSTARRWLRNGFAEAYDGVPGTVINEQVRTSTSAQIASQIAALQAELAQRTQEEGVPHVGYVGRREAGTLAGGTPEPQGAQLPSDEPVGRAPYVDPDAPHPLAKYELTEAQRTALEHAGFTRDEIIADATDEELMAVKGIGEAALKKLRG